MSSDIFKAFRVTIERCNSTTTPSCLNESQFNSTYASQEFIVDVPIVQYNLNPGSQKYKEFYVEDQNYFMFTNKLGVRNTVSIEQGTIETDVSIMPYKDK